MAGAFAFALASVTAAWQIPAQGELQEHAMTDPDPQKLAPDLEAIAAQTQPAALGLLKPPALKALQTDLRALKEAAGDETRRKALAKAVQRIAAEKRRRKAAAEAPAPETPAAQPDRAERKRLKEAEKAEKQRVKELEKAEAKAARKAARLAGKGAEAKPAGQGGKRKPAKAA